MQVAGYHLYFYQLQRSVKESARQYLRSKDFSGYAAWLTFPVHPTAGEDRISWEGDDEFSYRGEMYDVIEKIKVNDQWLIKCISDKKEDSLIAQYTSLAKDDWGNTAKKRTSTILKLIDNLFVYTAVAPRINYPVITHTAAGEYDAPLASLSAEVLTPPPRNLSA